MEEKGILKLKLADSEKENDFLKSSCILCEGNRQVIYKFIDEHKEHFGLRWLLKRCGVYSNGYYNYLKNIKRDYSQSKKNIQNKIIDIFHATGGIIGHRQMVIFLAREGIKLSKTTVHKFMNKELKLYCIPTKKRHHYVEGTKHEVFPNYVSQNFYVEEKTRFGAQTLLASKFGTGSFDITSVS